MSPLATLVLLALSGHLLYRQTLRRPVTGRRRFKLAVIYAMIGLAVGGFTHPHFAAEWKLLAASLALSLVVGLARGHLTRLWAEDTPDGPRVYSQGTVLTLGLFLGVVVAKFGLDSYYASHHAAMSDDGGLGEFLILAVMVAFQAELIWRRARRLAAGALVESGRSAT